MPVGKSTYPLRLSKLPQDNGEQQISKNNQQHAWQYIFDIKENPLILQRIPITAPLRIWAVRFSHRGIYVFPVKL